MGERTINWLPPIRSLNGDQIRNLGMCSDRGLNLQTFDVWNNAATN